MIALSAGHNPSAKGASSEGFYEFPESMVWATEIARHLSDLKPVVVETGTLSSKVRRVNELVSNGAVKLCMEVHFNSCPQGGAHGSETLYHPNSVRGKSFANAFHSRVATLLSPDRGVKEGWYRMDRPGIIDFYGDEDGDETPDYFLRATLCPAIIWEPAFIQDSDFITDNMMSATKLAADALRTFIQKEL